MKLVHFQQGTPAWAAWRATRFGSSEAAAMLGLSPYSTRSELLRMKYTGLPREFGDWFQRNVLDKGHAVEAATRPVIEAQIGDQLSAVVCEGEGRLAASCDGLDFDGALAWECKQWNEALAAAVEAGAVPDTHMPQCQHILLVTGAQRLLFTVSDGAARIVTTEVLPSPEWFQRLRYGWAQFERDLAAYVPPAAADPAPVGKAPDTLPALRIELTGQVTASNLAEFKATALGAIRSVNRTLKTDRDFADAEKAVKWCADVEARLKAAKEHALSQTASIDELFRALDEIAAESKAVRLDIDKLVTRRKTEVREDAVAAARSALDLHIAAVNAEIAPMRLQPQAVDFAGAIKGRRSIDSMQDALDTLLASAKVAADAQGRAIRSNVLTFRASAAGLESLFADLHQLVHKPSEDFVTLVDARISKHRADEAAREIERQRQEAERIAAAERRAAAEAEARVRAEQEAMARKQREAEEAERLRLRDEQDREDARRRALQLGAQAKAAPAPIPMQPVSAAEEPATLKLGAICERLGFTVTAAFLADTLHIKHSATDKAAKLYRESDWPVICRQLTAHINAVREVHASEAVAV